MLVITVFIYDIFLVYFHISAGHITFMYLYYELNAMTYDYNIFITTGLPRTTNHRNVNILQQRKLNHIYFAMIAWFQIVYNNLMHSNIKVKSLTISLDRVVKMLIKSIVASLQLHKLIYGRWCCQSVFREDGKLWVLAVI